MGADNVLLIPFKDESETFTLGFECGMLWERIKEGEKFTQPVHAKNIEQIESICEAFSVEFRIERVNEEWAHLEIFGTKLFYEPK